MLPCKLLIYYIYIYIKKTLRRNILFPRKHHPDILLSASRPQAGELGIGVRDRAANSLWSEQFCHLGRSPPSALPAAWAALGSAAWDLAPSQLQLDFGTDETRCLQDGKNGEERKVTGQRQFEDWRGLSLEEWRWEVLRKAGGGSRRSRLIGRSRGGWDGWGVAEAWQEMEQRWRPREGEWCYSR